MLLHRNVRRCASKYVFGKCSLDSEEKMFTVSILLQRPSGESIMFAMYKS